MIDKILFFIFCLIIAPLTPFYIAFIIAYDVPLSYEVFLVAIIFGVPQTILISLIPLVEWIDKKYKLNVDNS